MNTSDSCNVLSSCKYDVFISFRGTDTRNNFTSHLYDALRRKKIEVYKDDITLPRGEKISPALYSGIEDSRISIVVFSRNYATSRWCLEELVHILKCNRDRGQIVLPVFYGVDPLHVRKQEKSYAKAFVKHEKRFKDDMGKVLLWRSALEEAGNLPGWDSRDRFEAELVEEIAQVTLLRLYSISATIGDELQSTLVGLEESVDKIVSLLCLDSPDVRIIGIWGMGGIGKTTLAEVVQKRFSSDFESCFIVDVGNDIRKLGLRHLAKEFFGTLLKDKDVDMNNSMAIAILQRTKAFVVLDNIDDLAQLECLVGASELIKNRFGKGSRIILTSRDKKLLTGVADYVFEVKALSFNKALELFYQKAFRRDSSKITDFIELSTKVVDYTGGNPLALKVLGSYLHSRSIKEWESALSELKKAPNEKVQRVLKISFDGLDHVKQSIFLDIGCFFKGEMREAVEGESHSHIGVNVLVENCLITIDDDGRIGMHDLIQEMAWEIARRQSVELGQRSRLWNTQDTVSVLGKNKGSAINEGISLDLSDMSKDLYLRSTAFEAMENLRIIKIVKSFQFQNKKKNKLIHLHQGLQHLPESLRYLIWIYYPLKSLPSHFEPQNLVRLEMSSSKLEKLWDGDKALGNLKYITLSFAENLIELPDLVQASKLEHLDLSSCSSLRRIPKINCKLKYLNISFSGIEEFHPSFESHENLQHLDLSRCNRLKSLSKLPRNIRILYASGLRGFPDKCASTHVGSSLCCISHLPEWLGDLVSMEILKLSENNFERLPSSIKEMTELKDLNLAGCEKLESLPDLPSSLQSLDVQGCKSLQVISVRGCMSLKKLNASGCMSLAKFSIDERGLHSWEELLNSSRKSSVVDYLSFMSCLKLEPRAKMNILIRFLCQVFGLATSLPLRLRGTFASYAGNEIPYCFRHQHEGSSITVNFPQLCCSTTTVKGFVASVVLSSETFQFSILCKLSFKTSRGTTQNDWLSPWYISNFATVGTPLIYMWYSNFHFDISMEALEDDTVEAIFDFEIDVKNIEIKRCGVHIITLEEAEEFVKHITSQDNSISDTKLAEAEEEQMQVPSLSSRHRKFRGGGRLSLRHHLLLRVQRFNFRRRRLPLKHR